MSELPSTKPKQRQLVSKLRGAADNLWIEERAAGREPSVHLRILRESMALLYEQMFNRAGPRGRPVSEPITPAKIKEVFRVRDEHPSWSQQEIAYATNINIGRVSEILHGKRT